MDVPSHETITGSGVPVSVAAAGDSWSSTQLGTFAPDNGVYILYADSRILYVGQTMVGNFGNFGERLRRHCQEKASSNSEVYKLLLSQTKRVHAFFVSRSSLPERIRQQGVQLSMERMALLMEQALIGAYEPPGNRR